ncbi:hypothetical protein FEM33_15500 [Dyadobacter flavalbus]|uniref:Uncharacterized protein n=1 Tax=Dyadobacter flavalbus TaxID=2579942 RepID=A0A5M8QWN1_9BACT|nr:hypothetical protein [Dyadobacter flavalbus]KAA6438823.1 hypothetical protein FEM33_15500 [Dyadobacter flavalbus]
MEEEEIKKRFAEEIALLGVKKNTIAQEIGFSAQTFTNVTQGRNLPGVLLLNKIQNRYPSFDSNYVVTGRRKGDDSEELKFLKDEVNLQRAIVSKLVGKFKGVSYHPQVDQLGASEMLDRSIWINKAFEGRDN